MALRARQRRKMAAKAQKVVPDATVVGLGAASAGPDPRLLVWMFVGGWLAITVLLSVAVQGVVIVGALPVFLAYYAVSKPRYVVLTDRGVAVLKRGLFNGRPSDVITRSDAGILERPYETSHGHRHLDVAAERVWIKDSEVAALHAGLA